MIKTILAPTDGSDHARKAVDLASELAEKYGAKMVLLHVLPDGQLPEELAHAAQIEHIGESAARDVGRLAILPPEVMARVDPKGGGQAPLEVLRFVGQQLMDEAERTARQKGAGQVETAVEQGDPAGQILDTAERIKADMIVMGRRGLGGLKGLLMGSVSDKVSHLAKCTCITVT
jgi:nucleotide-binding universal stress UspA family protein